MRYILVILSILLLIDNARSNNSIAPMDSSQSLISTSDSLNGIVFTFAVSKDTLRDYDSLSMALTALNKTSKADTILMSYRSCGWQLLDDSSRIIMSEMPSDTGIIIIPWYVITYIIEPNQSAEIYHTSITFNPPIEPETYSLILYYSGLRLEVKIPIGKTVTSVTSPLKSEPYAFQLFQNYPNPFNPTTMISFTTLTQSYVSLKIYEITGKLVASLLNIELSSGLHMVQWDASKNASGLYFCRMQAGTFTQTKKLILLR